MAPIEMLLYSFFLYVKWKPKSSRSSDDLMHYLETPFLLVKCSNQRYLLTKKRKGSLQQVYCSQSLSRVVLISLSLTHSLSHTQLLNCYLLSHPISFSLSLYFSIMLPIPKLFRVILLFVIFSRLMRRHNSHNYHNLLLWYLSHAATAVAVAAHKFTSIHASNICWLTILGTLMGLNVCTDPHGMINTNPWDLFHIILQIHKLRICKYGQVLSRHFHMNWKSYQPKF